VVFDGDASGCGAAVWIGGGPDPRCGSLFRGRTVGRAAGHGGLSPGQIRGAEPERGDGGGGGAGAGGGTCDRIYASAGECSQRGAGADGSHAAYPTIHAEFV